VGGYATSVDLAKLIATFVTGHATFVDLAKLLPLLWLVMPLSWILPN